MQDDSELLRQFADTKSETAFTELVRRHIETVYSVSLRRVGGDTHLAHDVTQAVFTDFARKAHLLSEREVLVGWLFTAARFAAAKAVRRDQQQQKVQRRLEYMSEHNAQQADEPEWTAIRPVLDDAIQELNERDRTAVLLYFFEKQTYRDLGAKLTLTENGARMRVERALAKLRDALGRRGITSTTAALAAGLTGHAHVTVPAGLVETVAASSMVEAAAGLNATTTIFMAITKTKLSVAFAAVVVGATIGGIAQHRTIEDLRSSLNTTSEDASATRERLSRLEAQFKTTEEAMSALKAQRAEQAKQVADANSKSAPKPAIVRTKDIVRDYPEYASIRKNDIRRSTLQQYVVALRALKLPPDQTAKLKELLVERSLTLSDARDVGRDAGIADGTLEMHKVTSEATKALDDTIASLIGKDSVEKLEAFHGRNGNWGMVDTYFTDMWDAGVPLSEDNSDALALLLRRSMMAQNPSPTYRQVDPKTYTSPADEAFFKRAESILSPAQLEVLKASRREDNQRQAIMAHYQNGMQPMFLTN